LTIQKNPVTFCIEMDSNMKICQNCEYFRSPGAIYLFGVCQCEESLAWYRLRINGKDEVGERTTRWNSCDDFRPKKKSASV
jgi:hypothetical protein